MPAPQVSALVGAPQRLAKRGTDPTLGTKLPVICVVPGLPSPRAALQSGAGTCAERVREHLLDLLDEGAVAEALRTPAVKCAVDWPATPCSGRSPAGPATPFVLQLVGYETWAAAAQRPSGPRPVRGRSNEACCARTAADAVAFTLPRLAEHLGARAGGHARSCGAGRG
jgi:hypothetical protein